MSQALWCDEGNHAFSSRDTGRREITITGYDENGNELSEKRLACSKHLPQMRKLPEAIKGSIVDDVCQPEETVREHHAHSGHF